MRARVVDTDSAGEEGHSTSIRFVHRTYLFPPEEPALKAKSNREPVASAAASLFNEIADLKSEILARLDAEE